MLSLKFLYLENYIPEIWGRDYVTSYVSCGSCCI